VTKIRPATAADIDELYSLSHPVELTRHRHMTAFVSQIHIARPPADVYAYATDPAHFPEWQADVVRVHVDGQQFTTTRRIGRGEQTMVQEIVVDDPPRRWAARAISGPIRPAAGIEIEPADGGSLVTFSLDFDGHGIGKALVPMVRRMAEKGAPLSYQALKERLENQL
jgi:uncharacterized protein YndB with AHSA1/START domain